MKQQYIAEARRILSEEIEALQAIDAMLDEQIVQAAEFIADARQVLFSGVGKSGIVAQKIAGTFRSVGVPAYFLHPIDALHGDLGMVAPHDVAVVLSKSGTTTEILELVQVLRTREIPVISIVHTRESPLRRFSTITLEFEVRKEACPLQVVPTSSTTVAMVIGDILAGLVMRMKEVTLEDFARNHPAGQLGRNTILRVEDVMHKGSELPLVSPHDSFRTVLVELSEKRLGCVCVVDHRGMLQGIITDGDVKRILQKVDTFEKLTAGEVMTQNPVTAPPKMLLAEAIRLMEDRPTQISVLPVVDEQHRCIGVLRLHDILLADLRSS